METITLLDAVRQLGNLSYVESYQEELAKIYKIEPHMVKIQHESKLSISIDLEDETLEGIIYQHPALIPHPFRNKRGIYVLEEEDYTLLKKLRPYMDIKWLAACHHIFSRIYLCSWHYVPDAEGDDHMVKKWQETVDRILPKMTQEIVDGIWESGCVGDDIIEINNKTINLEQVFDYVGC